MSFTYYYSLVLFDVVKEVGRKDEKTTHEVHQVLFPEFYEKLYVVTEVTL